jgi:isocitrate dehydrogenase (NAD+)
MYSYWASGAVDGMRTVSEMNMGSNPLHIALLPGDGIGPEVIAATETVIGALGLSVVWERHALGAVATGSDSLPQEVLDAVRRAGVALKGPVSTVAGRSGGRSLNVALRQALGIYAQVRPCRSRPGTRAADSSVDLAVIRDTTEDLYAGVEFPARAPETEALIETMSGLGREIGAGSAIGIKPVSEVACRRLMEFAIGYARRIGYQKVTIAHKATAMRATDGLFLEVAREVAAEADDLECDDRQVDALCADLVRRPEAFGVVATLNLYGDLLSDLAAAVTGGVGLAPGANYGEDVAVFEAVHGTAPRLAGTHRANPMAMVLTGALLLRHVGAIAQAARLESAVDAVLDAGTVLTYDLAPGGQQPASTEQVAAALAAAIRQQEPTGE